MWRFLRVLWASVGIINDLYIMFGDITRVSSRGMGHSAAEGTASQYIAIFIFRIFEGSRPGGRTGYGYGDRPREWYFIVCFRTARADQQAGIAIGADRNGYYIFS